MRLSSTYWQWNVNCCSILHVKSSVSSHIPLLIVRLNNLALKSESRPYDLDDSFKTCFLKNFKVTSSFYFFFFFLRDRVYLSSLGCPGTHSVDQKSACPCLPCAGIKGLHHHCPATSFLLRISCSGAGEMAQQLRALTALMKVPS